MAGTSTPYKRPGQRPPGGITSHDGHSNHPRTPPVSSPESGFAQWEGLAEVGRAEPLAAGSPGGGASWVGLVCFWVYR